MKTLRILQAEDNSGDVLIIREVLIAHGLRYELILATDGDQAIRLIQAIGKGVLAPDLLLLDLNLPKASGLEILEAFRQHPECMKTPVIVVTSSNAASDRLSAERLGADAYFLKPSDYEGFLELGSLIKELLASNSAYKTAGRS
jgi:chemotaxis family two-component system response regulator Rcp1